MYDERAYCIYIITNTYDTTLYVGATNNLQRRMLEHRARESGSFSERYHLWKLVYYEVTDDITVAIAREKQLKKWLRAWKLELIRKKNPEFRDLYDEVFGDGFPQGKGDAGSRPA